MSLTLDPATATAATAHDWPAIVAVNNARYWEHLARAMGRAWRRDDDVHAADPGAPNPFPNSATLMRPLADGRADEVIGRLRALYGARPGAPWLLWSAWPAPGLARHGLQLIGKPGAMVRWPWEATALPEPPELAIHEVADARTVTDWMDVIVAGYPAPEFAGNHAAFMDERVLGGPHRMWVGYVDGTPVTCVAAYTDGVVNGVFAVATLPGARGRGYGAAITDRAATADPALPAVLYASDLGRPVYRRLGFREIGRAELWLGHR